jgi:nucleoid DNA-binding protein
VGGHHHSGAVDPAALIRIRAAAPLDSTRVTPRFLAAHARHRAHHDRAENCGCCADPGKKGICASLDAEKRLRQRGGMLCCAPFDVAYFRSHASDATASAYTRGDSAMAKKGGAPTKSEILAQISKDTELSRKQVSEVFESFNGIIKKSLRGNGLFTMPGLLKLKVVKRPATKAREGVNPFTGEKMMFKAKPASKKVRALPLKNLKSFVN